MKATTIIITAVLSLQISVLFAGNHEISPIVNNETVSYDMRTLVPVTPDEATFEDVNLLSDFTFDFLTLAPVTPTEADFSDIVPEKNIDLTILVPVAPAEADFNDIIENQAVDFTSLAPVTPIEADFE